MNRNARSCLGKGGAEAEAKLRAIDGTERVFAVRAREEDALLEVALHYERRNEKNVLIFDSEKIDFQN